MFRYCSRCTVFQDSGSGFSEGCAGFYVDELAASEEIYFSICFKQLGRKKVGRKIERFKSRYYFKQMEMGLFLITRFRQVCFRTLRSVYKRYEFEIEGGEVYSDVFGNGYAKRVLISYKVSPFIRAVGVEHTNSTECLTAATLFDQCGYRVDVIQHNMPTKKIKYAHYEVVYGFGRAFVGALGRKGIKTIFYGTGCSSVYTNSATFQALKRFSNSSRGLLAMNSGRSNPDKGEAYYFSDLIIALGNDFVANTYRVPGGISNVKSINAFFFDVHEMDLTQRDYSTARNNFVWFGSRGCVHKGLDLVVEVFRKRPDLNVFICGANPREKSFFNHYEREMGGGISNIQNVGFVDLHSEQFKQLMNQCTAVVSPSASEGGAPAVLNVMANGGLIPIISRSSGLDVEGYGFVLDDLTEESLAYCVDQFVDLSNAEIKALGARVLKETRALYSLTNYEKRLDELIRKEIEQPSSCNSG